MASYEDLEVPQAVREDTSWAKIGARRARGAWVSKLGGRLQVVASGDYSLHVLPKLISVSVNEYASVLRARSATR